MKQKINTYFVGKILSEENQTYLRELEFKVKSVLLVLHQRVFQSDYFSRKTVFIFLFLNAFLILSVLQVLLVLYDL